jgi:hypothetical protein
MDIYCGSDKRYTRFKLRLSYLSQIEQDEQVKLFFGTLLEPRCDVLLKPIVTEVLRQRLKLTDEHLAYLLFASFQYVSDFRYDTLHRNEFGLAVWEDLRQHRYEVLQISLRNHLSTQCVNRYAALQVILAILRRPDLSVIDLGCATGIGLMSLNTYLVRRVKTSDESIASYLDQVVDIDVAIGVDIANPMPGDLGWMKACILPECKNQRMSLENEYNWVKEHGNKVQLVQANILDIPYGRTIAPNTADVIWTSNTLYEIGNNLDESLGLIEPVIHYLSAPNGVWIDAYYKSWWDGQFGSDQNPYQICVRSRYDFDDVMVVLSAPNDNIPIIDQGSDFHAFVDRYGT